jgi:hypothetical protein
LFTVQISTKKLGFLDAREISSDASAELFVDMSAGDKSILRKVFGIPSPFSHVLKLGFSSSWTQT